MNPLSLQKVAVETISFSAMHEQLAKISSSGGYGEASGNRRRRLDRDCAQQILDDLASEGEAGGVIIVVVDKDPNSRLPFKHVDGGDLTKCMRSRCRHATTVHHDEFKTMLRAFSAKGKVDRWTREDLKGLARALGLGPLDSDTEAAAELRKLEGKSKDGGIVLSMKGTLQSAGAHILLTSQKYQLADKGCRHGTGLALAEWMGDNDMGGLVFVRSDDPDPVSNRGSVHVMLPQGREAPPKVLHVRT